MADEQAAGKIPLSGEAFILIFTFIGLIVLGSMIINRHPGWPEVLGLLGLGVLWLGVVAVVMHCAGRRW